MMKELRDDLSGRIAWAKDLGMTQMFVPTLTGPANPTMDDVRRVVDEFNKMGEEAAKADILLGLHNEDFELTTVDGTRTYDLLLDLLDPKLIAFQFQISTISRGYDAAQYFTSYPGRFVSMHAQDWSAASQKTVALGQGDLDWTKIFNAAKTGGIRNYFVELNLDAMRASVPYVRGLKV
jgi:sugar phosphate isomerase/epimerase